MPSGKIAATNEKGFGFIKPDEGGNDMFFHVTGLINKDDFDELQRGDSVNYTVDRSQDRPRAIEVSRR